MNESNENGKKNRKEIVKNLLIIFLIIMLILTFFSNTIMNYSLPEVSTAYASQATVTSKVRGSGVVQTAEDYEVHVDENHVVGSVKVTVGDEVKEGDLLFVLEPPATTAGASVDGTQLTADEETTIRQAEQDLDTLELDYNKALLEVSPSYDMDNLEIRAAQAELDEALKAQQKAATKADMENKKASVDKELLTIESEITQLEEQIATVSGNSLKKMNKKLLNKKKKKEDLTNLQKQLENDIQGTSSPEEAAQTVREKQKALDTLIITLNDKKRTDGATSGKASLDLGAQRKKISDQREYIEKLKNKEAGAGPDLEIKAKNGGIIKQINCIAGDTVTPDASLAVIAVTGNGYSASFSVSNEQAKLVHPGQEATIMNIWGDDIKATLSSIKPDLEKPNENKILVFNITGDDVTVGQNLELSVGEKSAPYDVVVPNSAIRESNDGKFVLVVNVKSSPLGNRYVLSKVNVTIVASDDSSSAVSGGLYGNEYVVTNSNKPLEAGMKVRLSDS